MFRVIMKEKQQKKTGSLRNLKKKKKPKHKKPLNNSRIISNVSKAAS